MSRCTPLNPPSCLLSPNRRRRLKRRPKPNRNRQRSLPGDALASEEADAPHPDASEDLEATRRIDFGDLKFGRNYKSKPNS